MKYGTFYNGKHFRLLSKWSILEVCTGVGTAGFPRIPRDSRGNGYRSCGKYCGDKTEACGNTAGMELFFCEKSAGVYTALEKIMKATLCHDNYPWSSDSR